MVALVRSTALARKGSHWRPRLRRPQFYRAARPKTTVDALSGPIVRLRRYAENLPSPGAVVDSWALSTGEALKCAVFSAP